jgi:hypothetical protein
MEKKRNAVLEAPYMLANSVNIVVSPHDLWLKFVMEQPSESGESAQVEVARIVMPIRMLEPLIAKLQGLAAGSKGGRRAD